jgi:hypothetical protein
MGTWVNSTSRLPFTLVMAWVWVSNTAPPAAHIRLSDGRQPRNNQDVPPAVPPLAIQAETDVHHFLYLVSNYDLLLFLVKKFESCGRPVYFGLRQDFLTEGLCLSVQPIPALEHGMGVQGGGQQCAGRKLR